MRLERTFFRLVAWLFVERFMRLADTITILYELVSGLRRVGKFWDSTTNPASLNDSQISPPASPGSISTMKLASIFLILCMEFRGGQFTEALLLAIVVLQ